MAISTLSQFSLAILDFGFSIESRSNRQSKIGNRQSPRRGKRRADALAVAHYFAKAK